MWSMDNSLYEATVAYTRSCGLDVRHLNWENIRLDPATGLRIAEAFDNAQRDLTFMAKLSYSTLRTDIWDQYEFLTNDLGFDVDVVDYDPYTKSSELFADLDQCKLRVFSTKACGNPHPLLSDEDHDAFRAVHDAFGHGSIRSSFGPNGEEAAWRKHSQMFSPLSRPALTTETRGHTCVFFFMNGGRYYARQRAILLPSEFWP